jgi:3-oxoacyl-[acyl-carrier protein] reductase
MSEIRFDGRVAIITGAGSGLGRCHALEFARRGAQVVVNDLGGAMDGTGSGSAAADIVVKEIEEAGGTAVANYDSVSTREGGESIVKTALDNFSRLDILVNNAGILLRGSLLDHREDDFDAMWRTNVKGVLYCAAAVAPGMIDLGWGRVINLSSNAAVGTALPGTTFYAATKAAVLTLTRRLAFELGPHGITVNAVLPGFTRTEMTTGNLSPEGIAGVTDFFNQRSVLGRGVGEPDEIAHVVEFLSSERSGFMTGQLLLADGGRTDYLSHV